MHVIDLHTLFQAKKALVVGDFMLDVYTRGVVQRISPEAPVAVLCVEEEKSLPGGAGNAILNMISLGLRVAALGRVGKDSSGKQFIEALKNEKVECEGIFIDEDFQTPIKKRMIADNQQLLRVDYENPTPLSSSLEKKIITLLPFLIEDVDVIAISDYAKGLLTNSLLSHIIEYAKKRNIPLIVDPKGVDFKKYRGATLLKPNFGEAVAAAGLTRKSALDDIGQKILDEIDVETLMVTRSKEGISLFTKEKPRADFPAFVHEVKDVTGAGDTVLAVIAATLANRVDLKIGAYLSNVAAGIAIERIGCARISLAELKGRLIEIGLKASTL